MIWAWPSASRAIVLVRVPVVVVAVAGLSVAFMQQPAVGSFRPPPARSARVHARSPLAGYGAASAAHVRRALPVRYRPVGCLARGPVAARFQGPARKLVALTFDDGPAALTLRFVRMLRSEHVVATFFMIGDQLSGANRSLLHEELRDGDALGDHTWSHPDLVRSGEALSQLRGTKRAIRGLSGYTPCVFRPPYGAYDSAVVRTARSLGLATILWDVDPSDWALPGTGAIQARVLAQVRPGSIVLSHDGGGPRGETLSAYPLIIAALRKRGYRFVTVPQLLGFATVYRRCVGRGCAESAIQGRLPPDSIVEGARKRASSLRAAVSRKTYDIGHGTRR